MRVRTKRLLLSCALISFVVMVVIVISVGPISLLIFPPSVVTSHSQVVVQHGVASLQKEEDRTTKPLRVLSIDMFSDAAIGIYLWEHIFRGKLTSKLEGRLLYGFLQHGSTNWRFRTGPAVTPEAENAFADARDVVLVLNGRTDEKVARSRRWLEAVPTATSVRNVAVILLGNEQCENEWLLWYLESPKYLIRAVFVVYDSKMVDNKRVFQWPLGVATYRGFPTVELSEDELQASRPYQCHFMGTVYQNNSRLNLMRVLASPVFQEKCYIKARYEWPEKETEASAQEYVTSLRETDMVLSPLGMNAECYRIYEALAMGALPVIEDQRSPGSCDVPYRLLKEHNVPALFVSDWDELPTLFEYLSSLSQTEIVDQRRKLVQWYHMFLEKMRDKLVSVVSDNFIH
ncbi:hypothetical protein RvY_13494 [Ramazzottius varieornatus]|uniref:Exostosin GT47 domain-containing protein n=1 Tax=Ramazzottius varieornatus TaxID=947166 RepID=A0A1D1VS40_RAMVA|nr:hypothetical protein RvY_13494 [Ramazzottius varieornatus]